MFRFNAKQGFYLYPEVDNRDDLRLWMNKGTSYENNVNARDDVNIIKHGLKIPNNVSNYKSFVTQIRKNELEFKTKIVYYIK